MATLGVHVRKKAAAMSVPKVAKVSIPYVVGTAPVHTAAKPAKAGMPVLCTSWDEAVEKLGFAEDWKQYTLCEFMYSHFKLYGCQPVIFYNVLDTAAMKETMAAREYPVVDHQVMLPLNAIAVSVVVQPPTEAGGWDSGNSEGTNSGKGSGTVGEDEQVRRLAAEQALEPDTDYTVLYAGGSCIVELLEGSVAYDAVSLTIGYDTVASGAVTVADIVEGVAQVDAAMTATGTAPDIICAPGWSHLPAVAAVMATKAAAISSLFGGKALIDADSGADGVRRYSDLLDYKTQNAFVDENQILCWPMVRKEDYLFHLSTQLVGLMAQVDAGNKGIPYESPSNKPLQIDGCCLEDGTEVNLTWPEVETVAGDYGVVTAVNFLDSGWVAKGNYNACFIGGTEAELQFRPQSPQVDFIPVSRMFDFIGNTLIRTFWPRQDKPLTPTLRDSILQTCNTWLSGLCGSGYLYGARCELLSEENPLSNLLAGHITLHVYNAPPVPAQRIDFILEYDASYAEAALTS